MHDELTQTWGFNQCPGRLRLMGDTPPTAGDNQKPDRWLTRGLVFDVNRSPWTTPQEETSVAADRRAMEDTWQAHTDSEFVHPDVDATMATMTENPTVLHIPTAMGGRGRNEVKDFYERWFLNRNPGDFTLRSVSRTVGDERIVDEMVVSFTHDIDVPWILPGVAPTGRPVSIPLVAIVGFHGDAIDSEHIYWDQAAVLAQTQLLHPDVVASLPVVTEQSDVLASSPLNTLTLSHSAVAGRPPRSS